MKAKKIKSLLAITGLLLTFNAQAQTLSFSVDNVVAGNLASSLGGRINQITDLTLAGKLSGTDIKILRSMTNLAILNIENIDIVSGGEFYYQDNSNYYSTLSNVIGHSMFIHLEKLTAIILPKSVTKIETSAFSGCTSLKSVTIPEGVISIGREAFRGCVSLASVTIPNSVTLTGTAVFKDCTSLTSVTISESMPAITTEVFQNCTSLTSVTIPARVVQIGGSAFSGCTGLTEIHSKNPKPPTIASNTFENVKTTCKLYVPKGSADGSDGYGWKWGFDNVIEEEATAINTIDKDKIAIHPVSNGIAIETEEATPVSIFNIAGQKVYQSVVTGSAEIHLNKGVYIVRVGNGSQKVLVM